MIKYYQQKPTLGMRAMKSNFSNIKFFLIPLILTIGILPALEFIQIIPEAEAQQKAVGPVGAKSYGSKNNDRVCGDRLCSETEPTSQAAASDRVTQITNQGSLLKFPTVENVVIDIDSQPVLKGTKMNIEVEFEDNQGNAYEHVNYNIKATQNGKVVLEERGVYDSDGYNTHTTKALPKHSSSENPVDIQVEFLGIGENPDALTGPTGYYENAAVVPEFGTIAMMILGISIVSIIALGAKTRIIPKL
jgi:predicted secreted protein with PEFG-CTERM motif